MVIQLWEYMKPWIVQLKLVNYMVCEWYLMKSFLIPHPRIFFYYWFEREWDRPASTWETHISQLPPIPPTFWCIFSRVYWSFKYAFLRNACSFVTFYWAIWLLLLSCKSSRYVWERQTDRQTDIGQLPSVLATFWWCSNQLSHPARALFCLFFKEGSEVLC